MTLTTTRSVSDAYNLNLRCPVGLICCNDSIDHASQASDAPHDNVLPEKLSVRQYLDDSLMPTLLPALNELVKQKPEDPIKFIATFMLENNPNRR